MPVVVVLCSHSRLWAVVHVGARKVSSRGEFCIVGVSLAGCVHSSVNKPGANGRVSYDSLTHSRLHYRDRGEKADHVLKVLLQQFAVQHGAQRRHASPLSHRMRCFLPCALHCTAATRAAPFGDQSKKIPSNCSSLFQVSSSRQMLLALLALRPVHHVQWTIQSRMRGTLA